MEEGEDCSKVGCGFKLTEVIISKGVDFEVATCVVLSLARMVISEWFLN